MACIPGGEYILGSDQTDWKKENWDLSAFEKHTVQLSTFYLDKHEVTVAEYQTCVQARKCIAQRSNYSHMRTSNLPQLKVTWYQAREYCRSLGKRLPTEAEFEAASRGPNGDVYPWGNEDADCTKAVIKDETGRGCFGHPAAGYNKAPARFTETGSVWDVGSKPAWRFGLYDMSGNAQEWVSDWFVPGLKQCGKNCLGQNPKGPCNGADHCPGSEEKLVKGGSWYWGPIAARAASRRPHFPNNHPTHHFGFRCAMDLLGSDSH